MVLNDDRSHDVSHNIHVLDFYKPLIVIPTLIILLGVVSTLYTFYLRYKQRKKLEAKTLQIQFLPATTSTTAGDKQQQQTAAKLTNIVQKY